MIEIKNMQISKKEALFLYKSYYFNLLKNTDKVIDTDFIIFELISFTELFKRNAYFTTKCFKVYPTTLTINDNIY